MGKPILAGLLLCAACMPPQPTPAVVARMVPSASGRRLTACVVNLNWSEDDLKENCGQPDQVVSWAGHGADRCFLYRTSARSFAQGTGVEVVAACLHTPQYGHAPSAQVVSIFGLDSGIMPQ